MLESSYERERVDDRPLAHARGYISADNSGSAGGLRQYLPSLSITPRRVGRSSPELTVGGSMVTSGVVNFYATFFYFGFAGYFSPQTHGGFSSSKL